MSSNEYHSFQLQSQFAQLLAYIRRSQFDEVKDLIDDQPSILYLRDRNGRTALHHCADNFATTTTTALAQTVKIAQYLLGRKPELAESQDNEGNTALHLAVINGNQHLTRVLLQSMSSGQIQIGDYELHSAVHWATVCGELDCLTLVLDAGAEVSTADIYGAHPLHYATQSLGDLISVTTNPNPGHYGHHRRLASRRGSGLRILHHLLSRPHIDVNCTDNEGRTPLLWAASSGNHDALLALVKSGAEISQQDKDGLSALHCASSRGHFKCLQILIMICGADVGQTDSSGCTPLFYATALGHADCVRLLLESKADLDHRDAKGRTAAHCGAAKGQLETLKILHQHGANFMIKNVRGDLPIHEAIKSGRKDLIQWLLDMFPKSVNEVNLYGRSPLHIAAFNNNLEVCKLLVSYGADLNSVMKIRSQYLTPYDAALQNSSDEVIEYLRAQGAQPIAQINEHLNEFLQKENQLPHSKVHYKSDSGFETRDEIEQEFRQRRSVKVESVKFPNINPSNQKQSAAAVGGTETTHRVLSTSSTSSVEVNNSNKVHNVREFETELSEKPTHLKQAIITNVYLTTPVGLGAISGQPGAVYYVKRMPPLKKSVTSKKKRSSLTNGNRSRHTSVTPTRPRTDQATDQEANNVGVVLETHDTFESAREHREDRYYLAQNLALDGDSLSDQADGEDHGDHQATMQTTDGDHQEAQQQEIVENGVQEDGHTIRTYSGEKFRKLSLSISSNKPLDEQLQNIQKLDQPEENQLTLSEYEDSIRSSSKSIRAEINKNLSETDIDTIQRDFVQSIEDRSKDVDERRKRSIDVDVLLDDKEDKAEDKDETVEKEEQEEDGDGQDGKKSVGSVDDGELEVKDNEEAEMEDKAEKEIKEDEDQKEELQSKDEDAEVVEKEEPTEAQPDKSTLGYMVEDRAQSVSQSQEPQEESERKDDLSKIDEEDIPSEVTESPITRRRSLMTGQSGQSMTSSVVGDDEVSLVDSDKPEVAEKPVEPIVVVSKVSEEKPTEQISESVPEVAKNEDNIPATTTDAEEKFESESEEECLTEVKSKPPEETEVDRFAEKMVDQVKDEALSDMDDSQADGRRTALLEQNLNFVEDDDQRQKRSTAYVDEISRQKSADLKPTAPPEEETEKESDQGWRQLEDRYVGPEKPVYQFVVSDEDVRSGYDEDYNGYLKAYSWHDHPAQPGIASTSSPFGSIRQLKGKKKSYEHVRPKVDSFWNDDRHYLGLSQYGRAGRKKSKLGGSTGYLSTATEQYAQIDPKIINQTVEKYLRKYYLERKLFEELYDLKRYQIRTGKSNEPQLVKRLLEKFRREVKAPGMIDFKGPYTYRAYEMYIYDLLRRLSRSNEKKIAFLTKSISYDDINSSFERLGDSTDDGQYKYSNTPTPPAETSGKDPLFEYERVPFGLSVDYKYEYHKSQHLDTGGGDDEMVDVVCENLYKRTGMHGAKLDEIAITRKVVEKKNSDKQASGEASGGGGDGGKKTNVSKSKIPKPSGHSKKVWVETKPVIDPLDPPSNRVKRVRSKIPPRARILVPAEQIHKRWSHIKSEQRKRIQPKQNSVLLWYEVNKSSTSSSS